jgi:hypothetical protein
LPCACNSSHPGVIWAVLATKPQITSNALNCALLFGHLEVVRRVIAAGAKPDEHTYNCAVYEGHPELLRMVEKIGATRNDCLAPRESHDLMVNKYGAVLEEKAKAEREAELETEREAERKYIETHGKPETEEQRSQMFEAMKTARYGKFSGALFQPQEQGHDHAAGSAATALDKDHVVVVGSSPEGSPQVFRK